MVDRGGGGSHGEADGLTSNYARGFSGSDLEFLDARLDVRT